MLTESFYQQDAVTLAQALIGCELVHTTEQGTTAGIIVETEAYSQDDEASHSFRGQTKRNAVMFGPAGHAYIYFTYGMHYCMNVVAGPEGRAEAVLIRALQPSQGIELMKARRGTDELHNLCSGPAKLVQAMGILHEQNGMSLMEEKLFITPAVKLLEIKATPRIGIRQAADKPWRFIARNSLFITNHKFNRLNA
ncbi:DNA-3-methyladenine glycosylase [Patescibacteria group bacterium]|nr:MAG: DNA-3-methyladenine glycosylase [Patescibacteria group bacterium]